MNLQAFSFQYVNELKRVLQGFDHESLQRITAQILDAYAKETHLFVMGNGGSGAAASHFACDINKGCCLDLNKKFKVICLNDNIPTLLALANDLSYEAVFEEQLKNFFRPGDLVIGISGSGNSENILRAVQYAKLNGGRTIGFCGFSGGRLAQVADIAFVVNIDDMQKIEDVHVIALHVIMQAVYRTLHDWE